MISIYPYFYKPFEVLIFVLIAVISGFWAYARFKKKSMASFVPAIILNFVFLVIWAVLFGVAHDESQHLHFSWLVSKGMIPYKDFWQHHPPFLWMLLSPYFAWLKPSVEVFSIFRFLSGLVFAANLFLGWQIARRVWGGKAKLSVYLLILSSVSLAAQFLLIRPDIFMTFFLLAGIRISLEIPGKRTFLCFLAGVVFALAASFIFKQYLLILLPVIAVFLGDKKKRFLKLALYFLGFIAGLVPLLSYLIGHDILQDYIFWVLGFNSRIVFFSVDFPLGVTVMAIWGAVLLFKCFRDLREKRFLILFIAFCLSTLSSLAAAANVGGGYHLSFWFFICAITASGCDIPEAFNRISSLRGRSAIFGFIFSLFLILSIERLWQCRDPLFSTDKKTVAQLMEYCAEDTCLAFSPSIPVFSYDATRLHSFWQYSFANTFSCVRKDLAMSPIVPQIIALHPAVIPCRYLKRDFILDLFQKRLISAADYKKIIPLLEKDYTQKTIGKDDYYVRNDKLK